MKWSETKVSNYNSMIGVAIDRVPWEFPEAWLVGGGG